MHNRAKGKWFYLCAGYFTGLLSSASVEGRMTAFGIRGDGWWSNGQKVTAGRLIDPKTIQFYERFAEEEEEENAFILIGQGLGLLCACPPNHWSHACPKVPSIPWHVRSKPEQSVSCLQPLSSSPRQMTGVRTDPLSSPPPWNMQKGCVWGAGAAKVCLGSLEWEFMSLLQGSSVLGWLAKRKTRHYLGKQQSRLK